MSSNSAFSGVARTLFGGEVNLVFNANEMRWLPKDENTKRRRAWKRARRKMGRP